MPADTPVHRGDTHGASTRPRRRHEGVVERHAPIGVALCDPDLEGVHLEALPVGELSTQSLQVAHQIVTNLPPSSAGATSSIAGANERIGQPRHPRRDPAHIGPPSDVGVSGRDARHVGARSLLARPTPGKPHAPRTQVVRTTFGLDAGRHATKAHGSVQGARQRPHKRVLPDRFGVELTRAAVVRGDPERRGAAAQRLEQCVEMQIGAVLDASGARFELDQTYRGPLLSRAAEHEIYDAGEDHPSPTQRHLEALLGSRQP